MKILKSIVVVILYFILTTNLTAQTDTEVLKTIYKQSLTNGKSYNWLNHLSNQIGSRLAGSLGAERAVKYTLEELKTLGLDKVWLQPVSVPKWVRGAKEFAFIERKPGETINVNICALGGSTPTPALGLKARIVEVKNFKELETLGSENIKNKIVFYNCPMQADIIDTFKAYENGIKQRYKGALEAIKYGAVGVIVRSLTLNTDDFPHTGSMTYGKLPLHKQIPAAAISTNGADLLSAMLKLDSTIQFYFKQNCKQLKDVQSYNVIGEITGSEYPNKYITIGSHLDSWDLGDGAHHNGAGVVQSMDVLRLLKKSGIKPKHSIRVVLFMNNENGLRGAKKYAKIATQKKENHVFVLESDSGGFTPRGFNFNCNTTNFNQILSWKPLFKPYLIHYFEKGKNSLGINLLKTDSNILARLRPDSQRYFNNHHSNKDIFDTISKRELELGAATMASLIYLFDKYGLAPI